MKELAKEREKRGLSFEIEIDGGAGLDNIESIIESGTDIVVAGSSVFRSDDPAETVRKMKEL